MKKILLSVGLFSLVLVARSQTVLNVMYTDPGAGNSEFVEIYNSSTNPLAEHLNCYTMVTFYKNGSTTGWYVLDFPDDSVGPKGYWVIAAASPFNVQNQTGVVANANWNALAASGSLKFYQRSGSGYLAPTTPAPGFNDFLPKNTGTPAAYAFFLFKAGALVNSFMGGINSTSVPADITTMPSLTVTMIAPCSNFTIDWSTITFAENVNSSAGNDNGFARTSDGICGTWVKTSQSVNHTPGVTNGSGAGVTGSLTTNEVRGCAIPRYVQFDITATSGSVTEAADFPVEVQVYNDVNHNGTLDGADIFIGSKFQALVSSPPDTVQLTGSNRNADVIVVYKTKRGCFDKFVSVPNSCLPLPVQFKSFTATRYSSNVILKWETIWEQNNSGFAVERNVNGSLEQVGWVASQGIAGNSNTDLSYQYIDPNNIKGVTQYRIRQVDLDNKSKYTEIRSVRGDGMLGKTIVYPNPSNDGKVNVLFEDASVSRDVSVSDMAGRVVKEFRAITNNNITIENLQPGMYMVRIIAPETGEQVVQKIVVNKR